MNVLNIFCVVGNLNLYKERHKNQMGTSKSVSLCVVSFFQLNPIFLCLFLLPIVVLDFCNGMDGAF